jgi:hypothetical protein
MSYLAMKTPLLTRQPPIRHWMTRDEQWSALETGFSTVEKIVDLERMTLDAGRS